MPILVEKTELRSRLPVAEGRVSLPKELRPRSLRVPKISRKCSKTFESVLLPLRSAKNGLYYMYIQNHCLKIGKNSNGHPLRLPVWERRLVASRNPGSRRW